MKSKHIILRRLHPNTRDVFIGAGALPQVEGLFSISDPASSLDVDELDRRGIELLTRDPGVVAVAPSIPMKLIEPRKDNSNGFGGPPALDNGITWGVRAVGADSSPFSGDGVVVTVLDTGIDPTHVAFKGVTLVRRNFTNEGDDDAHGHGTHCAGTIFGRLTENTRIGVAPGVKTALIGKVLGADGGSSDTIASAIQWAVENGANIISLSLGMDFTRFVKQLEDDGLPTELATSRALEGYRANVQLFERLAALIKAQGAFGHAVMLIAAAGNESQRDVNPDFEIAVSPPAVAEGFLSVAALQQGPDGLTVAPFSNTGANLSAPGVNVLSAKRGGGLIAFSGTSMATPHVAGVAALWAEKIKKAKALNTVEWSSRVIGSASNVGLKPGIDPFDIGAGLIQAPK